MEYRPAPPIAFPFPSSHTGEAASFQCSTRFTPGQRHHHPRPSRLPSPRAKVDPASYAHTPHSLCTLSSTRSEDTAELGCERRMCAHLVYDGCTIDSAEWRCRPRFLDLRRNPCVCPLAVSKERMHVPVALLLILTSSAPAPAPASTPSGALLPVESHHIA
ncbi:hypothetical protein B0H14DRAFT_3540603 [Mycena olivaceomarginata]|nr:hypothetical protein B0H14DRAFT_3540603 [Mycena olivaceomarginata]